MSDAAPIDEIVSNSRHCACFNLRKATRVVTQLFDEALRPLGLKPTQYTLLVVIRALHPVPVQELAEQVVMDRTTLTRNLRPLERDGLIETRPGRQDRRVREVHLTAAGREMVEKAYPLWKEAQGSVVDALGGDRFSGLLGDLAATVEVAQEAAG